MRSSRAKKLHTSFLTIKVTAIRTESSHSVHGNGGRATICARFSTPCGSACLVTCSSWSVWTRISSLSTQSTSCIVSSGLLVITIVIRLSASSWASERPSQPLLTRWRVNMWMIMYWGPAPIVSRATWCSWSSITISISSQRFLTKVFHFLRLQSR